MKIILDLCKMRTETEGKKVRYYMLSEQGEICVNDYLGRRFSIEFLHQIYCTVCGKLTRSAFGQGFCYSCFTTAPQAEACVLNPEQCKAHLGISRNMEFSKSHCLIPHFVYLAVTADIKVGVTRHTQIPVRWIDQGANLAIVLAQTPNRHIAGLLEVALKAHFSDKTIWKSMLRNEVNPLYNLVEEKTRALELLPLAMQQFRWPHDTITRLEYPVLEYPEKPVSASLDKTDKVEGILTGIKGQYLMFGNQVINIRRHTGYRVVVSLG